MAGRGWEGRVERERGRGLCGGGGGPVVENYGQGRAGRDSDVLIGGGAALHRGPRRRRYWRRGRGLRAIRLLRKRDGSRRKKKKDANRNKIRRARAVQ